MLTGVGMEEHEYGNGISDGAGLAEATEERLGHLSIADYDLTPGQQEETSSREVAEVTSVPTETTRLLHTVSAVAAAAFADSGYASSDGLKLRMRTHVSATNDRDRLANVLQTFGAACADRSTVGIAVVSTTECKAQAWLFEVVSGDDYTALSVAFASDAPPPSLLLRRVDLEEDYLTSHAHGSAVGIDSTEGVLGIRLPDGSNVPRYRLAATGP